MKVSLICPIHNEESSVKALVESMLNQSKKADEIIFVGKPSDKTPKILKEYVSKGVRFIEEKSNIAEARNIAIKNARHSIIACTDASSKLDKDWLKNIVKPFEDKAIDVVSGGYIAVSEGGIEDYLSMVTVQPMEEWDEDTFLPSGRSIAFRKKAWKAVGGYPEDLYTGEDTLFDLNLKKKGFKFKLAKEAFVYWRGRETLKKFCKQFYLYGKGDGEARNVFKMKANLLFFLIVTLGLMAFIVFLFINPLISLILGGLVVLNFLLKGPKYAIKKKRIGALVMIPFLLFCKRMFYYFGIWKGL